MNDAKLMTLCCKYNIVPILQMQKIDTEIAQDDRVGRKTSMLTVGMQGWGVDTKGIINSNPTENISPLMDSGPGTSTTGITSKHIRNADSQSQSPPQS